jgi:branched-chain amino acid transport system permease protein
MGALVPGQRLQRRHMSATGRRAVGAGAIALLVLSAVARAPDAAQFLQFTILGIAAGAVYAIAASGVVLTYATTGVFNFAHGGLGMVSAFAYWQLKEAWDVPAPLAALLVLGVLGPVLGCVLELMFRGLRNADVGTAIVLTIAVTVLCIGLAQYAFKPYEAHNLGPVFAGTVRVFDATITWDDVLKIGVAAAIAIGLRALLFRSRAGTTMRAVVDDPALAALNGASSTAVARGSWILGTELAMVAGILIGSGTNLDAITLTFFVVNAYGAAVLGKLRSLPWTFAGAIALGLAQSWGAAFWFPKGESGFALADGEHWRRIGLSLPGLFLFVALLFLPQARLSVGRLARRRAPRVPGLRTSLARAVAFVVAVAAVAELLPAEHLGDATRALVFGVILLSLVLLTGYSGQVSLAQYVFVAIGAWAMGSVLGGSSPLGVLAAAVAPVFFAILVALPAMRLQGLYLALVTFGFASISRDLIIQDQLFFGGDAVEVGRPSLFGISFASDQSFVVLCGLVFALVGVGVLALRRGPLGRRFAAVRDSEAACATLGLNPRGTKLLAFCLSASIAGVGGALFGGSQLTVSDIPFEPINNIVLFLFAVVGGVTTVSGACIGGVLFALLPYVQSREPALAGLVFAGIAAVAISLGRQPNGLAGILASWVDLLRRPVANRDDAELATSDDRDSVVPR